MPDLVFKKFKNAKFFFFLRKGIFQNY